MDNDKSLSRTGIPPPSAHFSSSFPPGNNNLNVRPLQPSSSSFPLLAQDGSSTDGARFGHQSDSNCFSHDISRMPDYPPKNVGHRRAHSDILTLPDDISFDNDPGAVGRRDGLSFSDESEEYLLSMYLDMDKFNASTVTSGFQVGEPSAAAVPAPAQAVAAGGGNSSAVNVGVGSTERPRFRHEHSQSMDGSTSIKPDMLVAGSEESPYTDSKKAISAAKLAELAFVDPKRAKRIWANRQSAARSKERKMRYIAELEHTVHTLQTEATSLSAQLTLLQRDSTSLTAEISEQKLHLETMEQQVHLQDALNDALKKEIQHLKVLTGQVMPNGGPMLNYTSFGAGQQYFPNNQDMHTLLTSKHFQPFQIHSQKLQHQFQQQLEQQQQTRDLRKRGSVPSPNQNNASDVNPSVPKD